MLQLEIFRLLKKRDVARIGAGKTAFNVIDPERVEFLGNEQLVGDGKANAFALGAITQLLGQLRNVDMPRIDETLALLDATAAAR